jgi:hypothetical protein
MKCLAAAGAIAATVSCGDVARTGRSPVLLVIEEMSAASGADPGTMGGFLLSDVQTMVERTIEGETVLVPTIFNDVAQASVRIVTKDQGPSGTNPSTLNSVTLNRYRISYKRADGRNTPETLVTVPFEMVRHQAKLEQPLRSLVGLGGRVFISTIAEVTFYGSDLAGNDIQATGTISVSFGDYADPD